MPKISTITLPNGSTYDIGGGSGTEFIYGTQTAQTGSCLGVTSDSQLVEGKEILYFFPYGTSGEVSLNLTLAGGGSTGAINCYKTGLVRMKAFYQYETVRMTYHENLKIGNDYYTGWWADGDKDKDGQELALSRSPYTASAAFYQYVMLFTKDSTTLMPSTSANNDQGTSKTLSSDSFNPFGPIYRYNDTTAVASGGTIPDEKLSTQQAFDLRRSFNITTDFIVNKAVYLKCEPVSGSRRKARFPNLWGAVQNPITQDLPTTDDGYYYVYLGQAYTTYAIQMTAQHPVYMFKDGECREVSQFAEVADKAIRDGDGNEITATYLPVSGGDMTGQLKMDTDQAAPIRLAFNFAKGTSPSTTKYRNIYTQDTSGSANGAFSQFGTMVSTDGSTRITVTAIKNVASSDVQTGIVASQGTASNSGELYARIESNDYPILHSDNYPNYCVATSGGTMTGILNIDRSSSNDGSGVIIRHAFKKGTTPSAGQNKYLSFYSSDGKNIGLCLNGVSTGNVGKTLLRTYNNLGSGYADLYIQSNANGVGKPYYYQGADSTLGVAAAGPYELWHKGNLSLSTFSPTSASAMGTLNRRYFARVGPIVFFQFAFTNSSTISTNTNIFTGLPAAVQTSDAPLIQYGANANREIYINTSGQMKVSGSISTGNWVANGWYYTTAS